MQENYHKWYSHTIGKDMEMLVFGHAGTPVVLFPTSKGKYYENKDRGMIDAASWFIENGLVRIYCPDSIDEYSWYNKGVHPGTRAYNHTLYDKLINEEVLGRAFYETGHNHAVMAGASFGGYHAVNFGFRHPNRVRAILSMSGAFDIRDQVDGHYDDNVYFNNPVDFIPNASDGNIWNMKIILGCADNDSCLPHNIRLSEILDRKGIPHWLDIRPNTTHDWPVWLQMFPHYLSLI